MVDPPVSVITGGVVSGTVIAHTAVRPFDVLAVITAVPAALAVTSPVAETVATAVLSLVQVIAPVAPAGVNVAVSCRVVFAVSVAESGETVMPVGGTVTVTIQFPDLPLPSVARAVIVAVPAATPVTTPDEFTVATAVLLLLQSSIRFVALDGRTVATRVVLAPTFTLAAAGNVTLVTNIGTPAPLSPVVNFIENACSSAPWL